MQVCQAWSKVQATWICYRRSLDQARRGNNDHNMTLTIISYFCHHLLLVPQLHDRHQAWHLCGRILLPWSVVQHFLTWSLTLHFQTTPKQYYPSQRNRNLQTPSCSVVCLGWVPPGEGAIPLGWQDNVLQGSAAPRSSLICWLGLLSWLRSNWPLTSLPFCPDTWWQEALCLLLVNVQNVWKQK